MIAAAPLVDTRASRARKAVAPQTPPPKCRPILFSGPMILAILAGKKTVTRRLLQPQPTPRPPIAGEPGWHWRCPRLGAGYCHTNESAFVRLAEGVPRYGVIGDGLWVRETWAPVERETDRMDGIRFRADDVFVPIENTAAAAERWVVAANNDHSGRWRPSIHIPRWASRIGLEIVARERVERLQSITEEDAKAEGCAPLREHGMRRVGGGDGWNGGDSARDDFIVLWDLINGDRASWESNPWVRRVEFKVVRP